MDDRSMADMCSFLQPDNDTREHVNRAVFLDITPISNNDPTPIASYCCSGSNIDIFANDDIAGDCCKRVNERRRIYYRYKFSKAINHESQALIGLKVDHKFDFPPNSVAHLGVPHLGVPHCCNGLVISVSRHLSTHIKMHP